MGEIRLRPCLSIQFYPQWDDPFLVEAASEYTEIWESLGERITEAIQTQTGLRFVERKLNALVIEGASRSHPLVLRASFPKPVKAHTLVHELGHRIVAGNKITARLDEDPHINAHKLLYLFLFEVYVKLFGTEKALEVVEFESALRASYRDCWQWALALSLAERAEKFASVRNR